MEQQRVWPLRGRSRCMSASIDLGRLLSWQQRDEAPPDLQPGCLAGKCLRLRLCLTILRPLRIETLSEFAQTKDGLLPTCGDAMTSTRRCRRRFQEYRRMPRRRIWKDGINSRRYLSWVVVGPSLMVASARTLIGHGSSDSLLLASVTLCLSSSITVWGCVWLSRPVSTPHGTDSSES